MIDHPALDEAVAFIKKQWPAAKPACGLICGSGWSDVVSVFRERGALPFDKIPGLGTPGVVGHAGRLVWGEYEGLETLVFQGRRHFYEGKGWTPVALPVYVLRKLGARIVVLTNAAGGIRSDLKPGDLMLLDDHINNLGSPLIGPHNQTWGPRFPDQTAVYDPALRDLARRAAKAAGVEVKSGVYLASSGPAYETPAEIRVYRTIGADAVGMSTVPEAQLANAAGMRVLAISCITNYAAGISPTALTHEEVTATTQSVMPKMTKLFASLWKELSHA